MGRKREKEKKNDQQTDEPVAKVPKKDVEDQNDVKSLKFDVIHFRNELKAPTNRAATLLQFLNVCTKSSDKIDYISKYLGSGGTPGEILNQLDDQDKKNVLLASTVFSLLNLTLLNIRSKSTQLTQTSEDTCRYFLNTYVPVIEFMLSDKSNAKSQKSILRLLSTITMLNSELGVTVLNQLSLQPKLIGHLAKPETGKEKNSVRTLFVHFVMSFFIDNHVSLIKAALEKQGLVALVIPELVKDNADTVLLVLHVLKKSLLCNTAISKTMKIRTLNHHLISCLFNLFNWKNTANNSGGIDNTKKSEIDESLSEFLEILCTSHKYGIYFSDKYLGTGDILSNQYLWKSFESLENAWNSPGCRRLLLKIVHNSPDLFKPIRKTVEDYWNSERANINAASDAKKHISVLKFLNDAFNAISRDNVIKCMMDMSDNQIFVFIKTTYLPVPVLKSAIEVFKSTNMQLKFEMIIFMHSIMNILKAYLTSSNFKSIRNGISKTFLKRRLEEYIPKCFPSTELLLLEMHHVLDDISVCDILFEIDDTDIKVMKSQYLISILDYLLLYDDVIPSSLDPVSAMLDTKRLFEKIDCINENKIELKLKTIMFLLHADRNAFTPDKFLFKELLNSTLEVYVSDNQVLADEAKIILTDIFHLSNIFENNLAEIELFLYVIRSLSSKYSNSLPCMTVDILEDLVANRRVYNDLNNDYSINMKVQDTYETSKTIVEGLKNYYKKNKINDYIPKSFSLTIVLVGVLKNMENYVTKYECTNKFIGQYVVNLLHLQECPDIMIKMLEDFTLDQNVNEYVFGWKSNPTNVHKKLYNKHHVINKMSKYLLYNEGTLEDIFSVDNECNITELNLMIHMVLFYVGQICSLNSINDVKAQCAKEAINYLIQLYPTNEQGSRCFVEIIERCLNKQSLKQNFCPLVKEEEEFNPLTDFVLNLIDISLKKSIEPELINIYLKPYKNILCSNIRDEISKCEKSMSGTKYRKLDVLFSLCLLDKNTLTLILRDIVLMKTECVSTTNNEQSSWIQILCNVLYQIRHQKFLLLSKDFNDVLRFYTKIIKELSFALNISNLEENIYECAVVDLRLVKSVPFEVFEDIFLMRHVSKFTSKLLSLLLKVNSSYLPKFSKIIVKENIIDKREFVFPLISSALYHLKYHNLTDILKLIYDHYKPNIVKIIEKPHKATQIYIENEKSIIKLIGDFMEISECVNFYKKIHKFDTTEIFHINILNAIFTKSLSKNLNNFDLDHFCNFILCILNLGVNVFKREDIQYEKALTIASVLNDALNILKSTINNVDINNCENVISNSIWHNFFKFSLMSHFRTDINFAQCDVFFDCICNIIDVMCPSNHESINYLFEITTSHSEFLNLMIGNQNKMVKSSIVKMLLLMIKKNKSTMKLSHIPVYLSAYQSSLSYCDSNLLDIIRYYEQEGFSMAEYRPYLWGEIGANHYALKSNRKKSLWSNPTVNHILNLFDREKIELSITFFPVNKKLNAETINDINSLPDIIDTLLNTKSLNFNIIKASEVDCANTYFNIKQKVEIVVKIVNSLTIDDAWNVKNDNVEEIYNPSFIIPLLNYILAPESAVTCHRVLRCGILAIPLMALSSSCPLMRSSAYNVLYRFNNQLESEMFYQNDKILWGQFINTLKSSLNSIIDMEDQIKSPRLPPMCAMYLARSALIMTNPLDPVFKPVNNFIISKQFINFTIAPDFLDLFHNTDINYLERRKWILNVIKDGIKTFLDIKIMLKSVLFKILFDFYDSCLCDNVTKLLIIDIVNRAVSVPRAAKILINSYGLIPWIYYICNNLPLDSVNILSALVDLVYNLTISLLIESTLCIVQTTGNSVQDMLVSNKCFKLNANIEFSLFSLLLSLLNRVSKMNSVDVEKYLSLLNNISSLNVKRLTETQVIKLINEPSINLNPVILSNMSNAIKGKKIKILLPLEVLNDYSNTLNIDVKLLKYLYGIVIKWLS